MVHDIAFDQIVVGGPGVDAVVSAVVDDVIANRVPAMVVVPGHRDAIGISSAGAIVVGVVNVRVAEGAVPRTEELDAGQVGVVHVQIEEDDVLPGDEDAIPRRVADFESTEHDVVAGDANEWRAIPRRIEIRRDGRAIDHHRIGQIGLNVNRCLDRAAMRKHQKFSIGAFMNQNDVAMTCDLCGSANGLERTLSGQSIVSVETSQGNMVFDGGRRWRREEWAQPRHGADDQCEYCTASRLRGSLSEDLK